MSLRMLAAVLVLFLVAASPASAQKLKVVATFSILGDMVERVAADHAEIVTLVGPNGDAHMFEPAPAHARAVAQAHVVFANGLGFDTWIDRLLKSTGSRARLVLVSARLPAQGGDPHAWQNVQYAPIYAENIARALAAADAPDTALFNANAAKYIDELRALDGDIRIAMAKVPKPRRRVITTHDAFGYFAAAYDVEFLAPLGISTEEQPSAKGVARLITQIKREKILAVFVENISDPRLIEQISRQTGARIGGKLYSDALSPKDGPAPTYVAMMRHNAKLLTLAMTPGS